MDDAQDPRLAEEMRATLVPDDDAAFAAAIEARFIANKLSARVRRIFAASMICLCVAAFMTPVLMLTSVIPSSSSPWAEVAVTGIFGGVALLSVLLLREALLFLESH